MIDFKQIFLKEKWVLVKTYDIVVRDRANTNNLIGKFYLHLSESNKGNRKVEPTCTIIHFNYAELNNMMKKSSIYHEIVHRWLKGRRDPDIPRYDQIDEEDVVNFLKGKI